MSIDFSKVTALSDQYGNIVEVTDESGRVLWMLSGGKVILEVEKITSDTYAGETTYTGEQFILLDIYPKTNGTVSVTYGGLTKTITDTSGAAEPNAQQVLFGTFNGVSDSVSTPASGELTIDGDYIAFGQGSYAKAKANNVNCLCVTKVTNFGNVISIPVRAFGCNLLENRKNETLTGVIKIPNSVTNIGDDAFAFCSKLTSVNIPSGVTSIGAMAFTQCEGLTDITFQNTSGWYVTLIENGDVSTGTAVDVTDQVNNVALITATYSFYYWYRA